MRPAAAPQLSIVIPVYNNWWLTERCLRVLEELATTSAVTFETIVVDNASHDETAIEIENFSWVRSIRNDRNRNFAGACNQGAAAALAPIVLFLNNDAYPLDDALAPLVRVFQRSDVAIASGALVYEDGVTQDAGMVVLQNAHWHHSYRNLPSSLPPVAASREALAVGGAAMAVRRGWFCGVGGFDETYVNGFEDVDLCLRAREERRSIRYVGDAVFAHYEGASEGRFDREHDNERRFYDRWSAAMANVPRVRRGEVGAIVVHGGDADPLLAAAREDLEEGLTSFGHPVVHDRIAAFRRLDRRFRRAASFGWFSGPQHASSVTLTRTASLAELCVSGAVQLREPWLPCAAASRVERCGVRPSSEARNQTVAVCGSGPDIRGQNVVRISPEVLLGGGNRIEVACVVHSGLTDAAAFGNVLLARAGIPAVVRDTDALRAIFAPDVALFADAANAQAAARRFVDDVALRKRYGRRLAADASRRFSPRRTAIRVVDLLCAARFGFERPAKALSNSPLRAR